MKKGAEILAQVQDNKETGCGKYNQDWLIGLELAKKILYHRMTRGNLI